MEYDSSRSGHRGSYAPRGQRGYWRGPVGQPAPIFGRSNYHQQQQRTGVRHYTPNGAGPTYNQSPRASNEWAEGGGRTGGRRPAANSAVSWMGPSPLYGQPPPRHPPMSYEFSPMYVHPTQQHYQVVATHVINPQTAAPVTPRAPPPYYGHYGRFPQQQHNRGRGHQVHRPWNRGGDVEAKHRPNLPRSSSATTVPTWDRGGQSVYGPNTRAEVPVHHQRKQQQQQLQTKSVSAEDDGTQRERLMEALSSGDYECMVCCDRVRQSQPIWNCQNCYNIFHLGCVRKWARASTEGAGWRCPGCQHVTDKVPYDYLCFCGKRTDPEWNRYDTPHGCGEQCCRKRRGANSAVEMATRDECHHPCNLLCHPGPCPPCGTYVPRVCNCGKIARQRRCGESAALSCDQVCKKLLNCGQHKCEVVCHDGQCKPCSHEIDQGCFCGKGTRKMSCGAPEVSIYNDGYSCDETCGKTLGCGHHECGSACHPSPCEPCRLGPDAVTHCPCGATLLSELLGNSRRTKCTDPVPTCGKICNKELACGAAEDHHRCTSKCHVDRCPLCDLKSLTPCRCGHVMRQVECSKIFGEDGKMDVTCERRCNKKKSCGRHKCQKRCCAEGEGDHRCALACGRRLKCGIHSCDDPCHPGNCPPCWNTSFEELSCHCGASITYPPVPCGTKPPECNRPCSRHHPCDHPVLHNCHSEARCPPCTNLTEKWCYGQHEKRTCIPCHETAVCCGLPCSKPLPCGRHKCSKVCHLGPCAIVEACTQPCPETRPSCGHPCGAPCHSGDCPSKGLCKAQVTVKCKCGHRRVTQSCAERAQAHRRIVAATVASKLRTADEPIKLTEASQLVNIDTVLDCNEECAATERNRRLALALQIRNPDLSNKLSAPAYSDFLKDIAKQNPSFVASVYEKLTDLVQSAKKSKQKSRSHAFPPMRSEQRRVIHELAELFGCETQSYDEEPKKNIVVTAFRDKSWLPSVSLVTVVQKESGSSRPAGKAPPPVPHYHVLRGATQQPEGQTTATPLTASNDSGGGQQERTRTNNSSDEPIDYFDYTG